MDENEAMWRLKSKEIWIQKGDGNTKYFHHHINHQKSVNSIWRLMNNKGEVVFGFDSLANVRV